MGWRWNSRLFASALFGLGMLILVAPAGVISAIDWWFSDPAYHDTYYVIVGWTPRVVQALLATALIGAAFVVMRKG